MLDETTRTAILDSLNLIKTVFEGPTTLGAAWKADQLTSSLHTFIDSIEGPDVGRTQSLATATSSLRNATKDLPKREVLTQQQVGHLLEALGSLTGDLSCVLRLSIMYQGRINHGVMDLSEATADVTKLAETARTKQEVANFLHNRLTELIAAAYDVEQAVTDKATDAECLLSSSKPFQRAMASIVTTKAIFPKLTDLEG